MKVWLDFLSELELELGKKTVEKWLKVLTVQKFDACNLYLEAKNTFQILWFEEHVRARALNLKNANGKKIKIHLLQEVDSTPSVKNSSKKSKIPFKPIFKLIFDEHDPQLDLNNFIFSSENEIVQAVCREVTNSPKTAKFNPIYFYGPPGAGKTHLLKAISQKLKKNSVNALYARAETFTDHVVYGIRAGEMHAFRDIYRNIDVLLIDDIDIFSRKVATQEEFFHTFNTLHLLQKQIILSSKLPPRDLQQIEQRLISRFEWGIVLKVHPLDTASLEKLIKIKASNLKVDLSPVAIHFLINHFKSSPKAIVKALEALVLRLHLKDGKKLTNILPNDLKYHLQDLLKEEKSFEITPNRVIEEVAAQFQVTEQEITGKSQYRNLVLPRQVAMYICRHKLKLPFIKIGEIFARDHSTVISSIKKIDQIVSSSQSTNSQSIAAIIQKLEQ